MRSFRRGWMLVAALALATTVDGQTLYKLVGRDGRVTYTDSVPKGFEGEVTRLETLAPVVSPPPPASVKPVESISPGKESSGSADQRRLAREDLERRLKAAQARVESARKARSEARDPEDEEMQVVQRRQAPLRAGEAPPRASCFNAPNPATGAVSMVCPIQVPGEKFYGRQAKLDEEIARAEEALKEAERAYRRGTD